MNTLKTVIRTVILIASCLVLLRMALMCAVVLGYGPLVPRTIRYPVHKLFRVAGPIVFLSPFFMLIARDWVWVLLRYGLGVVGAIFFTSVITAHFSDSSGVQELSLALNSLFYTTLAFGNVLNYWSFPWRSRRVLAEQGLAV